tara:strand:- start:174 stop:665 length:492 start_codon:yes stop_codon:yes gene_type:complete
MTIPALYQAFATYNRTMNQAVYAVCADIPDDARKADRGAFFKSVHGMLNHLMFGDNAWMNRFDGGTRPAPGTNVELFTDFDEMRAAREALDGEIAAWAENLTDGWLAETVEWTSRTDNLTFNQPRWILVSHMFNHQTHHRGQLTTVLTQMGHDVGVTDFPKLV